ncbi:hypothetical protein MKX03_031704 [Papaver bracteatum]|nr:hypothetical protein MKX03_031704 [Papaver bracteatum]
MVKSMVGVVGRQQRFFVTSSVPKMKPATGTYDHHYSQQQRQQLNSSKPSSNGSIKRNYVPVYVSAGLILLAGLIGVHTINQQLSHNPAVRLKKKRRETLSEVEEPELVMEESDKFINKSFFRKVAHIQDFNNDQSKIIPDTMRGDAFTRRPRNVETLKSVGVDPKDH